MVNKTKVINFLQDFSCARLDQLQILFSDSMENFNSILSSNMVSKKDNIFVHNTKKIDRNMLVAIDILCRYKKNKRLTKYYLGYKPIYITFLTKENALYHIIIADEENSKGVVKLVNSYPLSIPKADKLILVFPNKNEISNINCEIPFLYCVYPKLEIINSNI